MRQRFLQSKEEGYIEKGQNEGLERSYEQLILADGAVKNRILTEKTGSDKNKLIPTDIGNIVNDFLVANFSNILDFGFTAKVESLLMIFLKGMPIGPK